MEKALKILKSDSSNIQLQRFTSILVEQDPLFNKLFSHDKPRLERKIIKTLVFLKNYKKMAELEVSVRSISSTHLAYAELAEFNFNFFKTELIKFVKNIFNDDFTAGFEEEWEIMLDHIISIMSSSSEEDEDKKIDSSIDQDFIKKLGGKDKVEAIHKRLYDRLFEDDWVGQFFYAKSKETLIRKQTDFVMASSGHPVEKMTESPYSMHMHMYVTKDLYNLRQHYLTLALQEEGISATDIQRWIDFDDMFRESIQKKNKDECVVNCPGQKPITADKPKHFIPRA